MADKYDGLKLKNQICFPLYVCSKEIIRRYKPHLDALDLTYTQYIAMMVLWEEKQINVKDLGQRLYLDSGTLTPLLKKLESKGYITRRRSKEDERNRIISITDDGNALRDKAIEIPEKVGKCLNIPYEKTLKLYKSLYEILDRFE